MIVAHFGMTPAPASPRAGRRMSGSKVALDGTMLTFTPPLMVPMFSVTLSTMRRRRGPWRDPSWRDRRRSPPGRCRRSEA